MGTGASAAQYVRVEVDHIVKTLNQEAQSRARRAANILQNSAYKVLGKDGTGRRYKRGANSWQIASAPGQPPAPDFGNLRRNWRKMVTAEPSMGGGVRIRTRIKSDMPYSEFLEKGTSKMAARPYKQKVKEQARPEIEALYASL